MIKKNIIVFLFFTVILNAQNCLVSYNKYDNIFKQVGKEYHLPWFLLKAIAITENHTLNPNLKKRNKNNNTYDIGLMQINTIWIKKIKNKYPKVKISQEKLKNPLFNVRVGAYIILQLIKKYGYSWKSVSYYHSFTDKFRKKWLKKIKKNIIYLSKIDKRIKIKKEKRIDK